MHETLRDAVPLDPHRDEHDPQGLTTKLYCPQAARLQDSAEGNPELDQRPVMFKAALCQCCVRVMGGTNNLAQAV